MAIRAVLVDIDGVLTVSWRPVPGAVEALGELLARGLRIALVTNTTSRTRGWIAARLAGCGFAVSAGDILSGLEQACGHPAVDLGKPAPAFFAAALDRVGVRAAEAVMVGDDVRSDVLAAQAVGIRGVLVRTGKYLPETLAAADPPPDHVIDSFADLPALLGRLPA